MMHRYGLAKINKDTSHLSGAADITIRPTSSLLMRGILS
jgi:hypothetical protein